MRRDSAYLLDMLIAAREACQFLSDLTWIEFKQSRLHQNAVVKALEMLGEAAGQISVETRESLQNVPWRDIVGMRNRLVHAYFEVDLKKVWDTVNTDLPPLIAILETIVPPEEGE